MTERVFGAHGYAFCIDADDALTALADQALLTLRLNGAMPHSTYRVTRERAGRPVLWHGAERIGLRVNDDNLLLLLQWHINQRVIAHATSRRTTFHAAAARSPRGAGVLLAAPMEAGKSTTVTGLLRAGWDFLTDEAAATDPDGTIWAYPKPLTIDFGSWQLFPELAPAYTPGAVLSWLVPAPRTGAEVAESAPLRLIVFPQYEAGASTDATPVRPSEAALELSRATFAFDDHGARDLPVIAGLVRSTPAYRVRIGDLGGAVEVIRHLEEIAVAA